MTAGTSLVVVHGPAGAGKTTASLALAPLLGATVLSKDLIKEALYDPLQLDDDASSLAASGAAVQLIYTIASTSSSPLIAEANWKAMDVPQLTALARPMVQLFCTAPPEVLKKRVLDRLALGSRHPVHRDGMVPTVLERMLEIIDRHECQPLELSCPIIEIDTSRPLNPAELANRLAAAAQAGR